MWDGCGAGLEWAPSWGWCGTHPTTDQRPPVLTQINSSVGGAKGLPLRVRTSGLALEVSNNMYSNVLNKKFKETMNIGELKIKYSSTTTSQLKILNNITRAHRNFVQAYLLCTCAI